MKCEFSAYRTNMVWGKGKLDSGIVLVGEAPGRVEDEEGVPFVGECGENLDNAMRRAKLRYKGKNSNCFITNALGCRPCNDFNRVKNRRPTSKELENCRPRLQSILRAARPRLVILLGNSATESVFALTHIPANLKIGGVSFVKSLHPAAIMYNRGREDEWEAFWKAMRKVIVNFKHKKTTIRWKLPLG